MSKLFFNKLDDIDAFINQGPQSLSEVDHYLAEEQLQLYFLTRIVGTHDPNWLDHLVDAGLYNWTTDQVQEPRVIFNLLQYLLGIAPQRPEAVRDVIDSLPNNIVLHDLPAIAELARALPAPTAASLVPKLTGVVRETNFVSDAERVGQLVVYLGENGYFPKALELLSAFLDMRPDSYQDVDSIPPMPPTPQARLDSWEYGELLRATMPPLAQQEPLVTFDYLCNTLERALKLSTTEPESLDDHSTSWQSYVVPNADIYDSSPRESLVAAICDQAINLVTRGSSLPWIVESLESRTWSIFRRIALYVLATSKGHLELVTARLTDLDNFDNRRIQPEYNLLLEMRFGELGQNARQFLLDRITQGPEPEDLVSFSTYLQGVMRIESPDAQTRETNRWVNSWKRRFLKLIKSQLTLDEEIQFSDLLADISESDVFSPGPTVARDVGPRSPITLDELKAMPVSDLVTFLKAFEPSTDFMGDSASGVARVLQTAVGESPKRFAEAADLFATIELNPTYHVGFLRGLREALRAELRFPWPSVVTLAEWVIRQDDKKAHRYPAPVEQEPGGFHNVRLAIPDLFSLGYSSLNPIPMGLHLRVWDILERLTDDPDPAPIRERQPYDLIGVAINAVRTEALASAVEYAFWVSQNSPEIWLKTAQRFWRVMEKHLDLTEDESRAVRSVYGRKLPWLERLDGDWVRKRLDRLFPKDDELTSWYEACWDTYLLANAPYNSMFEFLEGEYARAIRGLKAEVATNGVNPETRLAEHVLLYYVRGLIDLNAPGNLLTLFYDHAPLPLRRFVIEFLGRLLRHEREPNPLTVQKLTELIDYRIAEEPDDREFSDFGYWLDAPALSDTWKAQTASRLLERVDVLDPLRMLLAALARFANKEPEATLACLEAISEKPKMTQNIYTLRKPVYQALQSLLALHLPVISKRTVVLANTYGALGLWELRDLVKGMNYQTP